MAYGETTRLGPLTKSVTQGLTDWFVAHPASRVFIQSLLLSCCIDHLQSTNMIISIKHRSTISPIEQRTAVTKQPKPVYGIHQPWPLIPKWNCPSLGGEFGNGHRRRATESRVLTRQSVYIPEGNFSPRGGAEQGGRHVVGACQWSTGQPAEWRHLDMWVVNKTHTYTYI